ncbi:MAG: O-methyltransferase [Aggregatilineales bacterium]
MMPDDNKRQQFEDLIADIFAKDDDALKQAYDSTKVNDMPAISVNPQDGALLNWLLRSINAKTAVEIGTLAGYSGIWIARGLAQGGKLYTVEVSSKHKQVAQANFDTAGVADKVEIVQGQGRDVLPKIAAKAPFDFVFIDANKDEYPFYLEWATENVRSGGIIAAHNAYRNGNVLDPKEDADRIMRDFIQTIADDPRLLGMIVPLGDGMAIALKQ